MEGSRDAHATTEGSFSYDLPPELIAQHPAPERDGARLMVIDRGSGGLPVHSTVQALPSWLRSGDLLVVNRSRVIPARLHARRAGGGAAEILLIASLDASDPDAGDDGTRWRALVRPARRLRAGSILTLVDREGETPTGKPVEVGIVRHLEGQAIVALPAGTDAMALLDRFGETPLPPYIRRPQGASEEDRVRYQTVFAAEPGSIAAPTAGLHLTERLLAELRASEIEIAEVVLHVGPATFLAGRPGRAPLAVEPERYEIPTATRQLLRAAAGNRRVVAVGTTTTRALESAARAGWPEGMQETSLVLSPGVRFAVVGALLTNMHLPGSSLLALVSAFAGTDVVRRAYEEAVARRYRFYSYGDAMLLL
ncbi:tRNA preQ1(34) S-adenosylmethionine ribosyltransferase-isomerase QueA [Candidatus Binatia bacterium]|nr:tRNA preQ1(34) S-adenosylmethionine ribosyltransferase-isomerase QueA [Candidatus Binatia bacterium]